ncbi:MAG: hypothetical protein V1929_10035 [bacterium]
MTPSEQLETWLGRALPRILSQVCRDPNSACYGCFDRNWWHYKVRDFPSIILQQGGYALWIAAQAFPEHKDAFTALAAASARFWNDRATRRGAFEEYYPWEQGYPPLAFSTLAVMKLAARGAVERNEVHPGARIAAHQLTHRFESQAANQQVAGLAALAWLQKVFPDLVDAAAFASLKQRTLALQHEEGWFEEYGGPDLGYLSVTMDCLWDLYDATQDETYIRAAEKALRFIGSFVPVTGASIGMHNARNTDYILPYGIARTEGGAPLLARLYANIEDPDHFVHAIDDRYLCHYAGHSLLRGLSLMKESSQAGSPATMREALWVGSGHYLRYGETRAILSLRKGGGVSLYHGDAYASDFGWVVLAGGRQFVNHWWSPHWTWTRDGDGFTVAGQLVPHVEHLSSPLKHMLLRAGSFVLGRQLIAKLKGKLIFQSELSSYLFKRTVSFSANGARVTDEITGLPPAAKVVPAPRASKRHVASADSGHREDMALVHGFRRDARESFSNGTFMAEINYGF